MAELAWNRREDLDTVRQRAEALVLGASSDTLSRRAVIPPSEWTEHLMEYLGQARTSGLAGVSTGLRDLDTMTLGLSPGLYLVAAATGTGERAGRVTTDALFWARVETRPFQAVFEKHARRELTPAAARDLPLWANPITQRVLALAAAADRRHRF